MGSSGSTKLEGALLCGRFRIGARAAEVTGRERFAAVNEREGTEVTVEWVDVARTQVERALSQWEAELRATAGAHPGLARWREVVELDTETTLAVFDGPPGKTLATLLVEEMRLSEARAVSIMAQVLDAVEALHQRGHLHRAWSLDELALRGPADAERVTLFGAGAWALAQTGPGKKTWQGVLTPLYMAPEQARAQQADVRTDVYALGAILYHLLSGTPPYEGHSPASLLYAVLVKSPPPLREAARDLDPKLVAVVEKAMSRRPEARFASAAAMREALAPWVRELQPEPEVPAAPVPKPPRMRKTALPAAAKAAPPPAPVLPIAATPAAALAPTPASRAIEPTDADAPEVAPTANAAPATIPVDVVVFARPPAVERRPRRSRAALAAALTALLAGGALAAITLSRDEAPRPTPAPPPAAVAVAAEVPRTSPTSPTPAPPPAETPAPKVIATAQAPSLAPVAPVAPVAPEPPTAALVPPAPPAPAPAAVEEGDDDEDASPAPKVRRRQRRKAPPVRAQLSVLKTRIYSLPWVHGRVNGVAAKINRCFVGTRPRKKLSGWRVRLSAGGEVTSARPLDRGSRSRRLVSCMRRVLSHLSWGATLQGRSGNVDLHFAVAKR